MFIRLKHANSDRLIAFLLFFIVSMVATFVLFQAQSNKLFQLSRKGMDNIDWTFFQVERRFEEIEHVLEASSEIKTEAEAIELMQDLSFKWDLFCSAVDTVKGPSFYFLLDYTPKSGESFGRNELKEDFIYLDNEVKKINRLLADQKNIWTRHSPAYQYIKSQYPILATKSKNVSMRANQRTGDVSADKQFDIEALQRGMHWAYFSQVLIILLFTVWGVIQIKNAKVWANKVVLANKELEISNKALEQSNFELEKSKNKIMAAFKERNLFIAKSAHELRTPLNSILGFIDLANDSMLSNPHKHFLNQAQESANHLLLLTEDILDYAKVDSIPVIRESLSILDIIESSVSMMNAQLLENDISVTISEIDSSLYVYADAVRLKQIVTNLISNTIKYGKSGKALDIKGTVENNIVKIIFRDYGPGVPIEVRPLLFTPFIRGVSVDSNIPGTGIGLSTSLKLAQTMGGDLKYLEGEGACFELDLIKSEMPCSTVRPARNSVFGSVEVALPDLTGVVVLGVIKDPSLHTELSRRLTPANAQYMLVPDWAYVQDIYENDGWCWVVSDQPEAEFMRTKYGTHLIVLDQMPRDMGKLGLIVPKGVINV